MNGNEDHTESKVQKRSREFSIIGICLVFTGIVLILNKLELLHYNWKIILWICLGIVGFTSAIHSFIIRKRKRVFWASLIFFVSIAMLVHKMNIIGIAPLDFPATVSLALGFSFLVLYFYDPRRFGTLVPVLLFGGYGALYYLWWWDIIDLFDMKYYLHTYWPVLIILWGLSLIFRPKQ